MEIISSDSNKWTHEYYLKYHRTYYQNHKKQRNNDRQICVLKKRIKKLQSLLSKSQYLSYCHSQIKEWKEQFKDDLDLDQIILV